MNTRMHSFAGRLLGTASVAALSAAAMIGMAEPVAAQSADPTPIFGGGTTLSSLALRQIFDCYAGAVVANDGNTFSPSFTTEAPSPNLLPTTCTSVATAVEGLFAAVGSGNGQRAYIANDPDELFRGNPAHAPALVSRPSANPPFVDAGSATFATYPYPQIDFGASDSPLAAAVASLTTVSFGNFIPSTDWQHARAILAFSSTSAAYSTAGYGNPIQVPALEVPVAVAVNTTNSSSGVTWTVQSALSPNTQAGGAIQLSAAQLCAIFSGTVTDWSDTTTEIPYLDKTGAQQLQFFSDDNTNGTLAAIAYTSGSLPIKVVYRTDDSGTSYILTNYLANFCPLLDPAGTYNYQAIFTGVGVTHHGTVSTTPNLPSGTFANLIENIRAVRHAEKDHDKLRWVEAGSSNQEALEVGTDSAHAGRVGYLAAEFTQPYATSVTEEINGRVFTAPAPLSASLQSQNDRVIGVYHPGTVVGGKAQNFVAPTPANAETAWRSLTLPSQTATYSGWNIYSQVFPANTTIGGVNYGGLSVIGDPTRPSAYPITGATFLEVYSCYSDPAGTRVPALKNWLAWFFGGSQTGLQPYNPATSSASSPGYDPDVAAVIRNNGFHEIDPAWAERIQGVYLLPGADGGLPSAIAAFNPSGTQVDGCTGVTEGAL